MWPFKQKPIDLENDTFNDPPEGYVDTLTAGTRVVLQFDRQREVVGTVLEVSGDGWVKAEYQYRTRTGRLVPDVTWLPVAYVRPYHKGVDEDVPTVLGPLGTDEGR